MLLYFPAESPPRNPSGPSRNIRRSAFCCRALSCPFKRSSSFVLSIKNSNGPTLRFDHDAGKPHQPAGDLIFLVRSFERFVITLAASKNRGRQRGERRLAEALRQSLFRDGSSDAPVAILKRMDTFKIQVSNPGPR